MSTAQIAARAISGIPRTGTCYMRSLFRFELFPYEYS